MNSLQESKPDSQGWSFTLGPIRIDRISELVATGIVLAAAGVSPLMFVGAAAGYGTMNFYAKFALLPAIFVVIAIAMIARMRHWDRLYRGILIATVAGPLATLGLEAVRIIGFRIFHAMPGSMPMLMGVLITDRFMLGPNLWSDLAGWADHILVNGIGFALVYVLVFGRPRWWKAVPYAWAIATVFMLSPDMKMLGDIGYFGLAMGPGFAITVYLAHTLFGLILGTIVARWSRVEQPLWSRHLIWRGGGQ
jgi:hypothetical protein